MGAATPDVQDFAALLLLALTAMAGHSSRRQAEVGAAMHRAGLPRHAGRLEAALHLLQAEDCVSHLVQLSDGGMLLTVTGHPLGRLGRERRRPDPSYAWVDRLK